MEMYRRRVDSGLHRARCTGRILLREPRHAIENPHNIEKKTPSVDERPTANQNTIDDVSPDDVAPNINDPRIVDNEPAIKYDVMAVLIHTDSCHKCKKMGTLFADLQQDLDGKRVMFLRLDLTNAVTTNQSKLLGDRLAISQALQGIQSGNIVLLDRNGQRLETLDDLSGREYLADHIAMRL